MNSNYAKAYNEVIEILKRIPESDKEKIPKEIYQALEDNMDKEYLFKLEQDKNFEEQELLTETKAILTIFYRDYWATPEIKAKILAKQANELIKIEQEKKIKYNSEKIFEETRETPKLEMVVYQEETWYEKFIDFMKKFFSKKRDN